MTRIQVRSIKDHERIAAPAMERGHCLTREEVHSCRVLGALRWFDGSGSYTHARAKRASAALPHEGPGALAYYRACVSPNVQRRYARYVRIHGEPGYGSPND